MLVHTPAGAALAVFTCYAPSVQLKLKARTQEKESFIATLKEDLVLIRPLPNAPSGVWLHFDSHHISLPGAE